MDEKGVGREIKGAKTASRVKRRRKKKTDGSVHREVHLVSRTMAPHSRLLVTGQYLLPHMAVFRNRGPGRKQLDFM